MPLCERCMQLGKETRVDESDIYDMDDDGEYDTFLCIGCILEIEQWGDDEEFE
jgi:hypothetical protein